MKRSEDDRALGIDVVIRLPDGTKSEGFIGKDGGWSQWGADRDRLGRSVPIIEALAAGLLEEGLLTSDSDEDYDDEQDDESSDSDGVSVGGFGNAGV